jgi:hypothetical protein
MLHRAEFREEALMAFVADIDEAAHYHVGRMFESRSRYPRLLSDTVAFSSDCHRGNMYIGTRVYRACVEEGRLLVAHGCFASAHDAISQRSRLGLRPTHAKMPSTP